jgi:hypothetical protein
MHGRFRVTILARFGHGYSGVRGSEKFLPRDALLMSILCPLVRRDGEGSECLST